MIKFHPSNRLLKLFASGELSAGVALAVAVHLEYCAECRQIVREFECQHAQDSLQNFEPDLDSQVSFDGMLENIFNLADEHVKNANTQPIKPAERALKIIRVGEDRFKLPRVLSTRCQTDKNWHSIGGVHSQSLGAFDEFKANLVYFEPNTAVPAHTHMSLEMTVVLAGAFKDEQGSYSAGDFLVVDDSVEHMPTTLDSNSCLCLTVMDEPLQFTQGPARLLNPLAKILF